MIKSLKHIIRSLLLSPQNLKWVSTVSSKATPLEHLHALFNSNKTHLQHLDYELALVSALKHCSTHFSISQGQQIHSLILKSGLLSNTFIQNSLINMYARCGFISQAEDIFDSCSRLDPVSCNIMISGYIRNGRLNDARKLFDVTPNKGCVSYTTMIMGFAQNDCWREAIEVFKDMRYADVVPNEVTLTNVILSCVRLGGIWECRMLHALVIKLMFDGFVLVSTNLLHMYCICSSLGDARSLFDEMEERNIISWNVMLNGYVKAGLVELARELFERIPTKDVVSWGTMIDGFVQLGRLSEAFMMYRAMLHNGISPNDVMIVDLISGFGRMKAVSEGLQIHSTVVKTGFDRYDFIQATIIHFYAACGRINLACLQFEVGIRDHIASWNALIAGFMRNGMIEAAGQLFNDMPRRDVFSWSAMISGYTQSEQPKMAVDIFREMVASGVKPNQITMVSVFSAIASLGALEEGRWTHEYVRSNSISHNDNLSAAIIDMYAKCGSINTALEVFYQIRDRTSTVSPWNAIICGLAMHGHANLSLKIFSDLERRNFKLNSITFVGLLSACCHAGLIDLGERYFKGMKSIHNIDPDIKHYGCMVDLLGRAGRLEEAEEMIRRMPMKADVVIWGTLLAASRTHGNVQIGEWAAQSLAALDSSHGASRVLLSNIYADAGRWDDAFSIRKAMHSHGLKRLPGCSGVV
ncbi:hypothetical protein ACOSP7_007535 [Xanthoceras sorbifolium]